MSETSKSQYSKALLKHYFKEHSVVASDIESFNNFVDFELQQIIEENKEVQPTIIPHNIDEFKIRFDKIWVERPTIIEADGSKKNIFPIESRLRKITYAAPCQLEVSAHINGVQRELFTTQIANLPIMLKSKYCHLRGLSRDDLIKCGEDPDDPGGYFIINGTEKVLIGNKYFFYLGIYNGSLKPADREAAGLIFIPYDQLQEEIQKTPELYSADVKFFLSKYSSEIEKFLKNLN